MRVLIACSESQTECMAFRALGHEAYSVSGVFKRKVLRRCEDDKKLAGRLRRIAEDLTMEITGYEDEG